MTQTTHPHTPTHTQLSVCFQYILYLQLPPNLCEPPAPYLLPSIRLFGLKTRDETKVWESSKHRLQWSSVSTRLDPEGPLRVHWGSTDVTTSLTFSPTSVEQTQLQCLVFNSLPQLGVKHESVCLSVCPDLVTRPHQITVQWRCNYTVTTKVPEELFWNYSWSA